VAVNPYSPASPSQVASKPKVGERIQSATIFGVKQLYDRSLPSYTTEV